MRKQQLIYAGIGSRKTPTTTLPILASIGEQLAQSGWHLRSGYADGADMAFGRGCETGAGSFEMYLPWPQFNRAPATEDDARFIVPKWTNELLNIAERAHPAWSKLTTPVKCLMARNVAQVLGLNLDAHADMVVCWTPYGCGQGGTGQAIRVAEMYGIPVFDMALEADQHKLVEFVDNKEKFRGD